VNTVMHVLSRATLSSIFRSCGDRDRVLPMFVGVAVLFCTLALRASMVRIHSFCRGVSGNGDTFAVYEGDGAGDCGSKGVVESGCGVEAFDDGSEVVVTRMMSPD